MFKSKLARILSLSVCSALAVGMLTQVSFAASAPAPKGVTQAVASPQDISYVNYYDTFFGYYSSIGTDGNTMYFISSNPHLTGNYPGTMSADSATADLCRQYCAKITQMQQYEQTAINQSSRNDCEKIISYLNEYRNYSDQLSQTLKAASMDGISSLPVYNMYDAWNLQADADSIYSSILSSNT